MKFELKILWNYWGLINAVTRATVNNVICKWNFHLHCLCKNVSIAWYNHSCNLLFDMYARCLDFTQNILIMSQYSIKFWIYLNRYSPPTKFFIYLDNLTLIQLFLWKSVIRRVGMNYHCNRISVSSFRKWRIVNNLSFLFFFFTINLLLISSFTNTAHRFYTVWLSTTI